MNLLVAVLVYVGTVYFIPNPLNTALALIGFLVLIQPVIHDILDSRSRRRRRKSPTYSV